MQPIGLNLRLSGLFSGKSDAVKRALTAGLLLFGAVGICLSFSYLFISIQEIPNNIQSASGQVASRPLTCSGFIGCLRAFSIDLSAITPLLLCWFFFDLVRNAGLIVLGRMPEARLGEEAEFLPMHPRFDVQWVQLGLLGTLWGFMIIGWGMMDLLGGRDSGEILTTGTTFDTLHILLKAFGTALLSTFTGTVLAYVAGPVLIHIWRWIHEVPDPELATPESRIDLLDRRLEMTNERFLETQEAVDDLRKALETLRTEVNRFSPNDVLELWRSTSTHTSNAQDSLHAIRNHLESRPSADCLKDDLTEIRRDLSSIPQTVENARTEVREGSVRIETAISAFGEAIAEAMASLANALSQRVDRTGATIEESADTRKSALLDKLESIERTARKSERRSRVTVEVKDLETITALNEKLLSQIKEITERYERIDRKRSLASWWPFGR